MQKQKLQLSNKTTITDEIRSEIPKVEMTNIKQKPSAFAEFWAEIRNRGIHPQDKNPANKILPGIYFNE